MFVWWYVRLVVFGSLLLSECAFPCLWFFGWLNESERVRSLRNVDYKSTHE